MAGLVGADIAPDDNLSDDDWSGLQNTQREFIKKRVEALDNLIMAMLDKYGLPRDPVALKEAGYEIILDPIDISRPNELRTYRLVKTIETHTTQTKIEGNVIKFIVDGKEESL